MNKTALLLGAYGQTNIGDDLLLYNYLDYLRQQGYTKIYVNASEARYVPQLLKDEFPEMEIFETYRTSPLKMLAFAKKAEAVYYGGGTVFKELYATTGRRPYTVIAGVMSFNMAVRLMGKKIYGMNIAIGSLKTSLGKWMTRRALMASTKTIFRDEQSYQYARDELNVPRELIDHSTDGLFLNKKWQKPWHTCKLNIKKGKKQRIVGVNVLSDIPDWIDKPRYIRMMRQTIVSLLEDNNHVVLLPFQTDFNPTNDLWFMEQEIIPHIKDFDNFEVITDMRLDMIVSCLQQLDVLIGMRLHSLILATVSQTPFVAVCYDTKCWRFVTEANYPYARQLENVSPEEIQTMYHQVLEATEETKKQLAHIAKENYKEAERCIKAL